MLEPRRGGDGVSPGRSVAGSWVGWFIESRAGFSQRYILLFSQPSPNAGERLRHPAEKPEIFDREFAPVGKGKKKKNQGTDTSRATRNPTSTLPYSGTLSTRAEARRKDALTYQDPPRNPLLAS